MVQITVVEHQFFQWLIAIVINVVLPSPQKLEHMVVKEWKACFKSHLKIYSLIYIECGIFLV